MLDKLEKSLKKVIDSVKDVGKFSVRKMIKRGVAEGLLLAQKRCYLAEENNPYITMGFKFGVKKILFTVDAKHALNVITTTISKKIPETVPQLIDLIGKFKATSLQVWDEPIFNFFGFGIGPIVGGPINRKNLKIMLNDFFKTFKK